MNTRKQVLVMSALLLMMLVITGIYSLWDPSRSTDAGAEFDQLSAERAAILFARNCRLCHGDLGQGGALGARYPSAPALDRPDLQGFNDNFKITLASDLTASTATVQVNDASKLKAGSIILIDQERMSVKSIDNKTLQVERGVAPTEADAHTAASTVYLFDQAAFIDSSPQGLNKKVTNTITCGRVGTAMPAWAQSQGGPLSDEQIRQLVVLITEDHWDLVAKEDNVEDEIAIKRDLAGNITQRVTLTAPMDGETTSMQVDDVTVFNATTANIDGNQAIRIGDERLRLVSVPDLRDKNGKLPTDPAKRVGTIVVQRGVLGTTPLQHDVDEVIYNFPITSPPSINQSSCGQTAQAPAPAGTPELIENFTGPTVTVIAANVSYDQKAITVKAGGQIRIRLDNRDNGTDHNIAFYKSATDATPVSTGSVGLRFAGPAVDDTVFDVPAPGTYYFRCDVHPTIMFGTFTVTP